MHTITLHTNSGSNNIIIQSTVQIAAYMYCLGNLASWKEGIYTFWKTHLTQVVFLVLFYLLFYPISTILGWTVNFCSKEMLNTKKHKPFLNIKKYFGFNMLPLVH